MPATLPENTLAPRSLASIRDDETLVVQRILFDSVRAHLAALGVHEGQLVRCRLTTLSDLVLETVGGSIATVERSWARFVQVGSAGSPRARCA